MEGANILVRVGVCRNRNHAHLAYSIAISLKTLTNWLQFKVPDAKN
jgi:hypothetical protein